MAFRKTSIPGIVWPRQLIPPVVLWITVEKSPPPRPRAKQSALVGHETSDGVMAAGYAAWTCHRPAAAPGPAVPAAAVPATAVPATVPAAPRTTTATTAPRAATGMRMRSMVDLPTRHAKEAALPLPARHGSVWS
jgi:hypothetical protein